MPTITVPREFFRKERDQVYSDWKEAFWRELLTNSVDAGATKVDVKLATGVYTHPSGEDEVCTVVNFKDDGCGMTAQVLDDVYFKLGASTKEASGQVGGFGRARILTCFSMLAYEINTLTSRVTGAGAEYEHEGECHSPPVPGCELDVFVARADAEAGPLRWALDEYVSTCDLPIDLWVDGRELECKLAVPEEVTRRLFVDGDAHPWGLLYHLPEVKSSQYYVRVNGVTMFSGWSAGAEGTLVIELDATRSRELLTASRDSLHGKYQEGLNSFIRELAQEGSRALKDRPQKLRWKLPGTGFKVARSATRARLEPKSEQLKLRAAVSMAKTLPGRGHPQQGLAMAYAPGVERYEDQPVTRLKVSQFIPDFQVTIDHPNEDVREAAMTWHPETWEFEVNGNLARWAPDTLRKVELMLTWERACDLATTLLLDTFARDGRRVWSEFKWSIGWVVSDLLAQHETVGDVHYFMLNPLTDQARPRFALGRTEDLRNLAACALHEVAHTFCQNHNHDFAVQLTNMMAAWDQASFLRELREVRR